MRSVSKLGFVPALVLLILVLATVPAYGAAGRAAAADRPGAAQTAQPEPAEGVDTGLVAVATWVLLLPLVLMAKLKISAARRAAWWYSLPGLDIRQIADYLEDYRLDPDAQFRRWMPFWDWPLQ